MNRAIGELPLDKNDCPVPVPYPNQSEAIAFTDTATAVDTTYAGKLVKIKVSTDAWVCLTGAVASAAGANKHANIKILSTDSPEWWYCKGGLSIVRVTANGTATVVASGA